MILQFRHGWGYDAQFWAGLIALLPEWRCEADDRGYFGAPDEAAASGPCVVIAHSFGAMRALAAPPPDCRGLIAINGFDRFTGDGRVSPRIVERMLARFASEPATVLADFRKRCGDDSPFGPTDVSRLREDLERLRDEDRSGGAPFPILSIQATGDPLLPAPMLDSVFGEAAMLERQTLPAGGHLLPLHDAPYCARAIRAFVEHRA